MTLSDSERLFVSRTVRREHSFLVMSAVGVIVALALGAYTIYQRSLDPDIAIGARVALIVFILLNARLNLRQYRYAAILGKLTAGQGQTS